MDFVFKLIPLALLLLLLLKEFAAAFRNRNLIFQLPFLSCGTVAAMIAPTLIVNLTSNEYITDGEYQRFTWFTFFCMFVAISTYRSIAQNPEHEVGPAMTTLNPHNLAISLLPFLVVSLAATTRINPTEYGSVYGGSFAIFLFLARLSRPIQIIALGGYLLTKNRLCLCMFFACVLATISFIVISGRRSDTFFLALSVLVPLWAIRGSLPSKPAIALGMVGVLLVFFLLPVARQYTRQFDFSKTLEIDYAAELSDAIEGERTNEVLEVAQDMAAVAKTGQYSYGVEFWNKLVHQYVSSTLFGPQAKYEWSLPQPNILEIRDSASSSERFFDEGKNYLVRFGFGDAFMAFGWFGISYFCIYGYLTARLYNYCFSTADAGRRIFYCVMTMFIPYAIYDAFSNCIELIIPWALLTLLCANLAKSRGAVSPLGQSQ